MRLDNLISFFPELKEVREMSVSDQQIREMMIDGAMLSLLERSRQGEIFNLYEELEKIGFSQEEIVAAAIREMERQSRALKKKLSSS